MRSLVSYAAEGGSGGVIYLCTPSKLCMLSTDASALGLQARSLPSASEALAIFSRGDRCAVVQKDKTVTVFSRSDGAAAVELRTARRSEAGAFATGDVLLLADRTGDVRAHLCEAGNEGQFALGHTGTIITSVCMLGPNFVATADRDDKIRVSAWPETWRVQSYCLGHRAYVAAACDLTSSERSGLRLASVCGDLRVIIWDGADGRSLCEAHCAPPEAGAAAAVPLGISASADATHLAVVCAGDARAHLFRLGASPEGGAPSLAALPPLPLPAKPRGAAFCGSDRLFVALAAPEHCAMYALQGDAWSLDGAWTSAARQALEAGGHGAPADFGDLLEEVRSSAFVREESHAGEHYHDPSAKAKRAKIQQLQRVGGLEAKRADGQGGAADA